MCYPYADMIHNTLNSFKRPASQSIDEHFQQRVMNYFTALMMDPLAIKTCMLDEYYKETNKLWLVVSVPLDSYDEIDLDEHFMLGQYPFFKDVFEELGFDLKTFHFNKKPKMLQLTIRETA